MKRLLQFAPIVLVIGCMCLILRIAELQLLLQLWVPLLMLVFLLLFPPFALTSGKSLFKGLFDLELSPRGYPVRIFVVTLTAFCVAGAISRTTRLVLVNGPTRMGFHLCLPGWLQQWVNVGELHTSRTAEIVAIALLITLSAYFAAFAIFVTTSEASPQHKHARPAPVLVVGTLLALAVGGFFAWYSIFLGPGLSEKAAAWKPHGPWFRKLSQFCGQGYSGGHWHDHLSAMFACTLTLALYAILGWYGKRNLGRLRTVPALASALMIMLLLGWFGSALEFFLSAWHVSLLLFVPVGAFVNSVFAKADHVYSMVDRSKFPAICPADVLCANGGECAIVVAAAGGGIQAAAWTAQVLEGLHNANGEKFDQAVRMISGISGGSIGAACYVNWLARDQKVRPPTEAASDSSLDEVGWGLAWPDLWRMIFPFLAGWKMDRAIAMERAWSGNAACKGAPPELTKRLSDWNESTAHGELPALVMSATVVEVGGPLLLGTTKITPFKDQPTDLWLDGDRLHQTGNQLKDVSIVRAARLSASFPYVSPVARPDKADYQPHMIDGGFFDNSGMSTLTAWLDEALSSPGNVKRVLVIQINGFPHQEFRIPPNTHGGWLQQLAAPLLVLINGRPAGQVSHGQIEFNLMKEKWAKRGIGIHHAGFGFTLDNPPLSWHLMPKQRDAVVNAWVSPSNHLAGEMNKVAQFLACEAPEVPLAATHEIES